MNFLSGTFLFLSCAPGVAISTDIDLLEKENSEEPSSAPTSEPSSVLSVRFLPLQLSTASRQLWLPSAFGGAIGYNPTL